MKKYMASILCVLLSLATLLSLTACGGAEQAKDKNGDNTTTAVTERTKLQAVPPEHKGMIGVWTGTCDYSALYNFQFGMKFSGIQFNAIEPVTYTFDDEGYCTIDSNKKALYDNVMASVETYCAGAGITVDDFYAVIGNTEEGFRDSFLRDGDTVTKREIYNFSGNTFTWNGITYDCQYDDTTITYSLANGYNVVNLTKQTS